MHYTCLRNMVHNVPVLLAHFNSFFEGKSLVNMLLLESETFHKKILTLNVTLALKISN